MVFYMMVMGKGKKIDEVLNGVKVHRCYTVPRQTGVCKRMINYYSYVVSSVKYVLSKDCKASDGKPFRRSILQSIVSGNDGS